MPNDMPIVLWYYWVILGVILIILEIFTPGFFVAVVGFALILTGVFALIVHNIVAQIIFFGVVVTLMLVFLRPVLLKVLYKESDAKPSNADALVGKKLTVTETIDNAKGVGYVKYYSDSMPARSADGKVIEKGVEVIVKSMDGIKAIVEVIK